MHVVFLGFVHGMMVAWLVWVEKLGLVGWGAIDE